MELNRQAQVLVFAVDDFGNFNNIGEINQFDSLIWPNSYNGFSNFELFAPLTKENSELLRDGNILWVANSNVKYLSGNKNIAQTAMVIEILESIINEEGTQSYHVKGRSLESFLTQRIVWGTYNAKNKAPSTIMYELVDQNCINPKDPKRKIPYLENATDDIIGDPINYQKTGGEIYEALTEISAQSEMGFNILFNPFEKKLIFKVTNGLDRSMAQIENEPVVFSSDTEDLQTSSYYKNSQDEKSVALVFGEGEGANRTSQVAGFDMDEGFTRREMFVDARDLQSVTVSEAGEEVALTPEEYKDILFQRGEERLSEQFITESFEATLRITDNPTYVYGKDYFNGDIVTIEDKNLSVIMSARITEVQEVYSGDSGYSMELTFGYAYPSIIQKVRRQMLNRY